LQRYFSKTKKIQLVKELTREKTYPDGLQIRNVVPWLEKIDFSDAVL
jgi:hypothetical protein